MSGRRKELRDLLNRAAAALETPGDLTRIDKAQLIEDLTVAAGGASTTCYNDKFDPNEQISLEEDIAAYIHAAPDNQTEIELDAQALGEGITPYPEEMCSNLGRAILMHVVKKLRPDLLEKT